MSVFQLYKEIFDPSNNYNYLIINDKGNLFNKIELKLTLRRLINLSERYPGLMLYKNNTYNLWTYERNSVIIDDDGLIDKAIIEKQELIDPLKPLEDELFITLRTISANYYYNNKQDFFNILANCPDILDQLNNSFSLQYRILSEEDIVNVFLKEENLWLKKEDFLLNNDLTGDKKEINIFIQKFKENAKNYALAQEKLEKDSVNVFLNMLTKN